MMAAADGSFGYEMEIIVPAGSEAGSVEDLLGGEIAFTQETSNWGMVAGEDFTPAFSGSHDTAVPGELVDHPLTVDLALRRMVKDVEPDEAAEKVLMLHGLDA